MNIVHRMVNKYLARQKPNNSVPRVGHVARVLPSQLVSLVLVIAIIVFDVGEDAHGDEEGVGDEK